MAHLYYPRHMHPTYPECRDQRQEGQSNLSQTSPASTGCKNSVGRVTKMIPNCEAGLNNFTSEIKKRMAKNTRSHRLALTCINSNTAFGGTLTTTRSKCDDYTLRTV
ncbi:hypothetical protein CHS0354_025357 [Potamilus streckersoni]|uniref:Uncharacterized protein n=1 Tax=Potamilus streckersoni TaxID=2493646 RepID=A0AAE0SQH8_9BIVA|nr:hypothetical protein CHS0354_025357 [Potamilus streckersoni]